VPAAGLRAADVDVRAVRQTFPLLTGEAVAVVSTHPVRWLHDRWARLIIGICAAFHLLMAVVLAFAPETLVVTDGSLPVFALMGRRAWAVVYLIAGVASALLTARPTIPRMVATWGVVVPTGFAWTGTFAIGVINGEGSYIGLVIWPTLISVFVVAGLWLATHEALRPDEG
jgi:hypothetical protein